MTAGTRAALTVIVLAALLLLAAGFVMEPMAGLPRRQFWLATLPLTPLLGLAAWLAVRVTIDRSLRAAARAVALAGAGDHSARLPEDGGDTGALARAFNEMQEGLEASQNRTHAALEFQAMHDALTGLPNRNLLMDRLAQAIRSAQRGHHCLALMLADLDHFKEINDTLGHPDGDLVLQQAAERMRRVVRESDTVARLGGDEFAFLLPTANDAQAMRIAAKVMQAFEQPFEIEGNAFTLSVSIGISVFPGHGEDGATLMRRADVAMYAAKRGQRGRALYEREYDRHGMRHLAFRNDLRAALAGDQMMLCYQPVVDLSTGAVTGVEALARWRHPARGLLYPDDFIPLAERMGLIKDLTLWVIDAAAGDCREWAALGLELRVAINLSAHNLHDAELPQIVERLISGQPARLRLEVTESAVMPGPSRALEALNRLSAQGVRISIDDFGTGYSSLSYLKQLPVDELKIDKSFVTGMVHDSDDAVIVRSTIDLAHNIGLRVVAEGVEDQATYELLQAMHCDAVQGYYLSRPVPARELIAWLRGGAPVGGGEGSKSAGGTVVKAEP